MNQESTLTAAGEKYAAAYAAHYRAKDLRTALALYQSILLAHPESQEARYAQSQLENLVRAVVPSHELLDAQMKLAQMHVGHQL